MTTSPQISEIPTEPLTWDNVKERLVGRILVVELQHYDAKGEFLRHEHVWGQVATADDQNGIRMIVGGRNHNGKLFILPSHKDVFDSFTKPREGVFRLRSTGEEVESPNWFTTWMVTHPDQVRTEAAKPVKPAKAVDVKRKK